MIKFIKSFSTYGLIPIVGKFISILLLPLYTRLLSPEDYGAQDILVQIAIFMSFLISIEIYAGVGRYYYERKDMMDKQLLISTGLWITVLNGIVVMLLAGFLNKMLYGLFFDSSKYSLAFYLTLLWAPISAIYTYFLVIMRYEQKPKLYFTLVNIQLVIRILATVLCVAVLRFGVLGVIIGHIFGELTAALMFIVVLKKYIIFKISIRDIKDVARFSLPLVPAVIAISVEKPLIRFLVAKYLSVTDMGYFSIALQIAAILSFVQSGLMMSWQPHLFELITKQNYQHEINKIYSLFLGVAGLVSLLIILNGRLLLILLTTPDYLPAAAIIGFVVVKSFLEILRQISGCGPVVAKKTQYNMYYEIVATSLTITLFVVFHKPFGIVGLALAFLGGSLLKFIWSWALTRKLTEIKIPIGSTVIVILIAFFAAVLTALLPLNPIASILISLMLVIAFLLMNRNKLGKLKMVLSNKMRISGR